MKTLSVLLALVCSLSACQKRKEVITSPAVPPTTVQKDNGPAPKPKPKITVECGDLASLPKGAREVLVEDMVDGKDGEYRSVSSQVHVVYLLADKQKQIRVTTSAQLSANANLNSPDYLAQVDCGYLKNVPADREVHTQMPIPLALSRKDGTFGPQLDVKFTLFSPELKKDYKGDHEYWSYSAYSDLWKMKTQQPAGTELHIYKVENAYTLEFRSYSQSDDGVQVWTVRRVNYVLAK